MNFHNKFFERIWNWMALRLLPDDALKNFRFDDGCTPAVKTEAAQRADSPALKWERPSVDA